MLLGGALILFSVLSVFAEGQNTSCGNDFKALEKALQTGNNTFELMKAFYPPRQPQATFVTVHYTFLDADGNITCQIKWLWTSMEFYLIQPPSIFQLMSLFFTIPRQRTTSARITFKDDCRELVTWNEDGSCSCTSNSMLDVLSQRLKIYAMFNALDDIEIRYKSLGTVICEDEQDKEYDTGSVTAFLTCGVLIPFIVSFLMVMMVWSSRAKIVPAMNKEQNHANLAALVLTGLLFSTFVVILDFVALKSVLQGKHEFPKHSDFSKVSSLYFVIITTVFDAAIVLAAYIMLFCLRCLGCLRCLRCLGCLRCLRCLRRLVCCRKEHKPTWSQWMLASTCIAPLFCIASHSGYIIVAWVSDTKHAGPVTFAYIISFFYYFIIFRQLYIILSKNKLTTRFELYCCYFQKAYRSLVQRQRGQKNREESDLLPQQNNGGSELQDLPSEGDKSDKPDLLESGGKPSVREEEERSDREESTHPLVPNVSIKGRGESDTQATTVREETPDDSQSTPTFNFTAFFMEICLVMIPVGAHIFVIYSIVAIPVSLTDAPTDIYHIIQLAFIIGTGLFTYKLIYTEDESKQFTKSFVKYLQKKDLEDLSLNQLQDAEAAGKVVGKVAYTIMEQNAITNKENVCRANTEETNTHDTEQAQTSL